MKARRQIGARHVAWMRGAYGGGQVRPKVGAGPTSQPEPDGATWGTGALTGGPPTHSGELFQGPVWRGGGRGFKYCAVCLVTSVYAGCHSRLSPPLIDESPHADRASVDTRARAGCPELQDAFGRAGRPGGGQYPGIWVDESDPGGRGRGDYRRPCPSPGRPEVGYRRSSRHVLAHLSHCNSGPWSSLTTSWR